MTDNAVRFILGGRVRTLEDVSPTTTVLNWLREEERRTGTKEGCAEGDCGACTVVLGELDGESIRYRAVNACILFVPTLDGKQLITVEDLKGPDGRLHPVQQAMVDYHGSQCGFCTPGIVMSLFAMFRGEESPSRRRIDDVLAGNLCRCTGYRSIVTAAARMYDGGRDDHFGAREAEWVALLRSIRRESMLALDWDGGRYFGPRSIDDLAAVLASQPNARILAGGTDVGLWVTKLHQDLETVVYTGEVAELQRLDVTDTHIEMGAAVTLSDGVGAIAADYPAFGELIRRFGSVQIRNAGTMGGNVANGSPIGDSMPALIALGTTLVLRRHAGSRELPLDEFYLDYRKTAMEPGEFIERIRIPRSSPTRTFQAYKIAKRFDQDISGVSAAYSLELDGDAVKDIRICYGGMAATPKRAANCERSLTGRTWSDPTLDAAIAALADDFAPISDFRASADYRMTMAGNLLRKFWLETTRHGDHANVALYGR
jgi:xanthine dehydrogenase small subunit